MVFCYNSLSRLRQTHDFFLFKIKTCSHSIYYLVICFFQLLFCKQNSFYHPISYMWMEYSHVIHWLSFAHSWILRIWKSSIHQASFSPSLFFLYKFFKNKVGKTIYYYFQNEREILQFLQELSMVLKSHMSKLYIVTLLI